MILTTSFNYIIAKSLHLELQGLVMEVSTWMKDGSNVKIEKPPLAVVIKVLERWGDAMLS
jgi:hypothetical protein